jgi:hypothetical protein
MDHMPIRSLEFILGVNCAILKVIGDVLIGCEMLVMILHRKSCLTQSLIDAKRSRVYVNVTIGTTVHICIMFFQMWTQVSIFTRVYMKKL